MSLFPIALGLLLSVPQPAAHGGENEVTAKPKESATQDWAGIDRELAALAGALRGDDDGLQLGGRLIAAYANSSDFFFTGSNEDISGFEVRSARINAVGELADYDYKVQLELAGGTSRLRDAWVARDVGDSTQLKLGQFKTPFLNSGITSSSRRLFLDRAITGGQNDNRTIGVMAQGTWYDWNWWAALQNGFDGELRDLQVTGRLTYNLLGQAFDKFEGAHGAPEGNNLGIGVSGTADNGVSNGRAVGVEGEWTNGGIYLAGDVIRYDDGFDQSNGVDQGRAPDEILGVSRAGTTAYSVTLSSLMGGERFESALRYERFDDVAETSRFTFGLSFFGERGHKSKWQLNYVELESEVDAFEGNIWLFGYVLAW